jgi:hypothetical protein
MVLLFKNMEKRSFTLQLDSDTIRFEPVDEGNWAVHTTKNGEMKRTVGADEAKRIWLTAKANGYRKSGASTDGVR